MTRFKIMILSCWFLLWGCQTKNPLLERYERVELLKTCDMALFRGVLIHGRPYQGRFVAGKILRYVGKEGYNLPMLPYSDKDTLDTMISSRIHSFAAAVGISRANAYVYTKNYTTRVLREYEKTESEIVFDLTDSSGAIAFSYPGDYFVMFCRDTSKIKIPAWKEYLQTSRCVNGVWYIADER